VTVVNDSEEVENGRVNDKGVDDQRSVEGGGWTTTASWCVSLNKRADDGTDDSDHCWPNFYILQHRSKYVIVFKCCAVVVSSS